MLNILCILKTITTGHSIANLHIGTPVQQKYRRVLNVEAKLFSPILIEISKMDIF